MGFNVTINASERIELDVKTVIGVEFLTDTPDDSNARSTDLSLGLVITGKILTVLEGSEATVALSKWALTPAEDANCYASAEVSVISAGQVVRSYVFDKVYPIVYQENFDDETGVGTFKLQLKQKKDYNNNVQVSGGYSA